MGVKRKNKLFHALSVKVFLCFLVLIITCICSAGYMYYHIAYHLLEENTYSMLGSILQQSQEKIDSKLETAEELLEEIQYDPAFRRIVLQNYKNGYSNYYQDVGEIGYKLHSIRDNYADLIDSIYFCNKNGLELFTTNFSPVTGIALGETVWNLYKEQKKETVCWRMSHEDEIFSGVSERNVLTVFQVVDSAKQNIQYFIGINLKADAFQEELSRLSFEENGYVVMTGGSVFLHSENYQEIYGLNTELVEEIQKTGNESDWNRVENAQKEKLLLKSVVLENGWRLSAVMPEVELTHRIGEKLHYFGIILYFVVVVGLILSVILSRSVTQPVKELTKKIDGMKDGNLDVIFKTDYNGEVGILAVCLNNLISQIKQLLQDVKEKEKQRRKYELAVVQAQINPHFLYNTLASLKNLVQYGENDRAVHMIDMLIQFYRTGLGRGKMTVALKNEMDHISSYLEIQSMRYGDKINYQIEIPEEIRLAEVIKLSVQPLVENALYHGLKEQEPEGQILVSARKEAKNLVICVFDNGKGISAKKLEKLREEINKDFQDHDSSVTYGLRNVHRRICLKYGEDYGLKIQSVEGEYTQIIMTLPFRNMLRGGD